MGAGLEDLFGNERPGEPDEGNGEFRRALVVAAHPDDADFGAAGVSALLARAGWHVRYLVATDGSPIAAGEAFSAILDGTADGSLAVRAEIYRARIINVENSFYIKA